MSTQAKHPPQPKAERHWRVIMVDLVDGERTLTPRTVTTAEAAAVFRSWEVEELDGRQAVPLFWPATSPMPDWLRDTDPEYGT